MKGLTSHYGSFLFVGLFIFLFQNCSPMKFNAETSLDLAPKDSLESEPAPNETLPAPNDDVNQAPPEEGDPRDPYSGPCNDFRNQTTYPLEIPASNNNVDLKYKFGSYDIDAANAVTLREVLGRVSISSAQTVDAENIGGRFLIAKANVVTNVSTALVGVQINANAIQSIRHLAGLTCLHAREIGTISRVASGTKIIAAKVQKISDFVGIVRVYGAEIAQVEDFIGYLCLYKGAKVIQSSNVRGVIRNCD